MSRTIISNEAAQAIHDKIAGYDAQIDKAMAEIGMATNQIVRAGQSVQKAYEKREELAAELGRTAAPDFAPVPQQGGLMGAAPFPPNYRFRRSNPLPNAYPAYPSPFPPAPEFDDPR